MSSRDELVAVWRKVMKEIHELNFQHPSDEKMNGLGKGVGPRQWNLDKRERSTRHFMVKFLPAKGADSVEQTFNHGMRMDLYVGGGVSLHARSHGRGVMDTHFTRDPTPSELLDVLTFMARWAGLLSACHCYGLSHHPDCEHWVLPF